MKTFTESEKSELRYLAINYVIERMSKDNTLEYYNLVPVDNIVEEVLRQTKHEKEKATALSSLQTLLDIEIYKLKQDIPYSLQSQDLSEQDLIIDFTKFNTIEQGVMSA